MPGAMISLKAGRLIHPARADRVVDQAMRGAGRYSPASFVADLIRAYLVLVLTLHREFLYGFQIKAEYLDIGRICPEFHEGAMVAR